MKKQIPRKLQFHYHGTIQFPDPEKDTLDTMYVLAILNKTIEINARPINYLNTINVHRYYPSIMNEFIWSPDGNTTHMIYKKKCDNGKIEVSTNILSGMEMYIQYDKSDDYNWSYAKVKKLRNLLKDTKYILSSFPTLWITRLQGVL
jgi:hypothetical protein